MHADTTTTRFTRGRIIAGAGAAVLGAAAIGGILMASGAVAATTSPAPATTPGPVGIEAIWSDTDPSTRHALCTSYLADPTATWQVLAPVLTAHGADRASSEALLARQCADTVTLADLHN